MIFYPPPSPPIKTGVILRFKGTIERVVNRVAIDINFLMSLI